jgi:hypothetical protein
MQYAKLQRHLLKESMNDTLKKAFVTLVQTHPALSKSDKDFICDNIQNYETIDQASRSDILDVIDGLGLFVKKQSRV